jgi:hypothetical protein
MEHGTLFMPRIVQVRQIGDKVLTPASRADCPRVSYPGLTPLDYHLSPLRGFLVRIIPEL